MKCLNVYIYNSCRRTSNAIVNSNFFSSLQSNLVMCKYKTNIMLSSSQDVCVCAKFLVRYAFKTVSLFLCTFVLNPNRDLKTISIPKILWNFALQNLNGNFWCISSRCSAIDDDEWSKSPNWKMGRLESLLIKLLKNWLVSKRKIWKMPLFSSDFSFAEHFVHWDVIKKFSHENTRFFIGRI